MPDVTATRISDACLPPAAPRRRPLARPRDAAAPWSRRARPQPPARRLNLGTQPTPRHRVLSDPRPTVPCPPSSPHHTDARVQAWLGAPQNRQKCAPPQLKSFLEKTLMRANPPHLASRTVPPTHPPAPPHSAMPGTATLAPRAATTTPGRSPSSNRSPLPEEPR